LLLDQEVSIVRALIRRSIL